jgi:hypothetical protein
MYDSLSPAVLINEITGFPHPTWHSFPPWRNYASSANFAGGWGVGDDMGCVRGCMRGGEKGGNVDLLAVRHILSPKRKTKIRSVSS